MSDWRCSESTSSALDTISMIVKWPRRIVVCNFFFFQAEDGIRDTSVTGVQTCALPICRGSRQTDRAHRRFGSAGHETQHLDVRHTGDYQLGEVELQLRRNPEARAVAHGAVDRKSVV